MIKKEFVLKFSFEVPEDTEFDDESYVNDLKSVAKWGIVHCGLDKYPHEPMEEMHSLTITPLVKGGAINRGYWAEETTGRDPEDVDMEQHVRGTHENCEECVKIRDAQPSFLMYGKTLDEALEAGRVIDSDRIAREQGHPRTSRLADEDDDYVVGQDFEP